MSFASARPGKEAATDGGSGNFTVMINYDTVPSYDIRVGADHVIVANDGNVAFNNKPATLPISTPSGLVGWDRET